MAVGSTVVLSLIDRYFTKSDSLKNELSKQIEIFKKLYTEHSLELSLNFSDILNFYDEKIKGFEKGMSIFNEKLKCDEIEDNRLVLYRYKIFTFLIFVTYLLGIITIFIPEDFEHYSLGIFLLLSLIFAILTISIYNDFRM